jgi:hypothetical protein
MKRRQFLTRSLAATAATAAAATATRVRSARAASDPASQEFYELRTYRIPSPEMNKLVSRYLEDALLPALERQGLDRIGVFTTLPQDDQQPDHDLRVLIPYPTLDVFLDQRPALAADSAYQRAAADYLAQPLKNPAYQRIISQLMRAFAGMPTLELPAQSRSNTARIFELRTYESHNEDAAARKIEMFNTGEIQLMRDVRMAPVFFGEMLVGHNLPNLTYMLSASDMDAHKSHWKTFIDHPEWQRMKAIQKYKGTVSKIHNWFLKPTEYSGI